MIQIKERIIAAFFRLLPESRGFSRVTMDELSREAGLSKRTIYRYFSSKEEIIEAVLDSFLAKMSKEMDIVFASTKQSDEILNDILNTLLKKGNVIVNKAVIGDLKQNYPHLWDKIDRFRLKRIEKLVNSLCGISGENVNKDLDIRIIIAVVTASVQAVFNPDFVINNGLSFEEVSQQLSEILQFGIFGKK